MADTTESLDIALALIRSDLDKIQAAVKEGARVMDQKESFAVVRYVGALVDAQKADDAARKAAEELAKTMAPATLLQKLMELPAARELLERNSEPRPSARGKGKPMAE